MKTKTFTGKSSLSVLVLLTGIFCLLAPQVRADDEDQDPPTRVARISAIEGSVSLQPGGQGDWGSAVKNRPMTIGDKIWVDKDSRAELQAGQASIHLGNMTALSFLNLDASITQMRLPEGSVNFRVRELREDDLYEVDTPNLAFTVKQAGAFRIDVNENGDSSRIIVIRGEGQVTTDGRNYDVHAGEQAEFNGAQNPPYAITHAPGPDGLDRWAEQRDLREDNSNSGKYVSRDIPGYDDLDDNGTWRDEPEYGHVWYPNEGPDWSPYSDGSWNWVAPWGWTWVGYEPWGFAPYHYGRWAFVGGAWGWCPGPFFGPPIYGPAFVGFLGGGWGFGLGFGIGWFPLGWGEPFFPWFHCRHEFVERINVRNTFIRNVNVVNNHNFNFVNAHNTRAVTTASRSAFTNGERINGARSRVSASALNGARVNNSVGLKPTAHSSLGAASFNSHVARPSSGIENRSVMARTSPAPGASHLPVQTMNGRAASNVRASGQVNNSSVNRGARANASAANSPNNSNMTARQRELAQNRPPATANANRSTGGSVNNGGAQRSGSNSRTWEAQGNTTDRGRAPQGFGSDRPANSARGSENSPRTSASNNRPPWAGQGGPSGARSINNGRSYEPPQRNSSPSYGSRGYSSPRTYSSPSRSYPAPSRSYSAPSRSYSGGGGSHSSSGGGSHSSGGGGSHGSGGGGSHGGGHPHR